MNFLNCTESAHTDSSITMAFVRARRGGFYNEGTGTGSRLTDSMAERAIVSNYAKIPQP